MTLCHEAGTKVLCQHNHHVCTVISDLHKGDADYAKRIGDWQEGQHPPNKGDRFPLLCKCGQPYTATFPLFPWTWLPPS